MEKNITKDKKNAEGNPLQCFVGRAVCWWFGCDPDYDHPFELIPNYVVPCKRCGAYDTAYADRVGDSRHARLQLIFRSWWPGPEKCGDCGKRFGQHRDCLPF